MKNSARVLGYSIAIEAAVAAFGVSGVVPADLVITNAHVITVDPNFSVTEAVAVRDGRIIACGNDTATKVLIGPKTRVVDAHRRTVMPGLCDSHVHSYRASVSEFSGPAPRLGSLAAAFEYIRSRVASQPPESWIVLERVYPTRMREGRLPTKAELDAVAPLNPVYWNCGPVSFANSKALQVSGIDQRTANPPSGEVVKDASGMPTGLLRNAAQLLKVAVPARQPSGEELRVALKSLYAAYNAKGITSVAERRTEFAAIDLFRSLAKSGELTVRINCTRLMEPVPATLDAATRKLDELTTGVGGQGQYGPTGVGDDWVRMGPLKVFLDGGMLIGTAYMREPWGCSETYQITDPSYRGLLNVKPELLKALYLEATRRGWQLTAHCTGEASVDALLDCYASIHEQVDIRHRRFEICHANFQSAQNFARCAALGVVADVQPAWLYKDGASLLHTLGARRMQWFQPLKSWFDAGLVIGGGSDHMVVLDPTASTNPWDPWLGMWIALTRRLEAGGRHNVRECLDREQAIRFYTINNARLNFEETVKGSIEPGKLADFIVIDRDVLKCPVEDVRSTKVLMTVVGGKVVWEDKRGL
jgi:predicted amidohydrolase YtcJ